MELIKSEHEILKNLFGQTKSLQELKNIAAERRLILEEKFGLGKSIKELEQKAERQLELGKIYGVNKTLDELELIQSRDDYSTRSGSNEDYNYRKDLYG